jgi:tellurite resistance protein
MLPHPMENDVRINLLARLARSSSAPAQGVDSGSGASILSLAATSYSVRPSEDATVPTGFDPQAVALFEAIVEGAYLVATADGVFDEEEHRIFERVVVAACGGTVVQRQIAALLADLADQLKEDGLDRRIEALAATVTKKDHALEVLRVASLLAQTSEDVSSVERDVLRKIAVRCGLGADAVDQALADVKAALSSPAA